MLSYCKSQHFPNPKFFIDDGYSGTNYDRPSFQRMISDIDDGKVNCVIVKDMSRLGRNYLEVGKYTEMYFPANDVRLIAINNDIDSATQQDNDFTPFLNIINEWLAKDTSRKVKIALHAKFTADERTNIYDCPARLYEAPREQEQTCGRP